MTKTATQKNTPMKPAQTRARSLAEVVKTPEAGVEVMAVVLDCTGYYKTNHSYDYLTKVRLVDGTHDPRPGCGAGKLAGFVTAYIFAESAAATPTLTKVGDVLLLRAANFDTYKGHVKCKVPKRGGQWAVFDGRPNGPRSALCASAGHPGLERAQLAQLVALRGWALHFFLNNSLRDLGWYDCVWPRALAHDKTYQLKDVDLLVKVLGSVQILVEGKRYQKLAFGDAERNFYFAELSESHLELEADMLAKLRSVCLIRAGSSIRVDFYKYSAILLLPEHCRDARDLAAALADVSFDVRAIEAQFFEEFHLEKYRKRPVSHNTFVYELGGEPGPDLAATFQILEGFSYAPAPAEPLGAYVKKTRLDLPLSPVSALNDCLGEERRRKAGHRRDDRVFRVHARLTKAAQTDLRQIAHFYSPAAKCAWPLHEPPDLARAPDLRVVLHVVLSLQDASTGAYSQDCHLFTSDDNPAYFFDLWRLLPDMYNLEQWRSLKPALVAEFGARFQDFIKRGPYGHFVLALQESDNGKSYLRIVDTILGFYV